ncbi:MAG: DUF5024 domain-containing protein [Paramuribaculum sp.]|nr:DUF5024 domain-containing protein [Paramuribaculum sp.]
MRPIVISLLLLFLSLPVSAAGDWHDDIISEMNSEKNVERAVVVDRDPETGKVRKANYRYTFKQKSLYNSLRTKLINRENEATNFILRPGADGQIILKFANSDCHRNYSLSRSGNRYTLIISAGSGELKPTSAETGISAQENKKIYIFNPSNISSQETAKTQERVREAQQRAKEAQQRAKENTQQRDREALQLSREALPRAREAQQRAEKARQQTEQKYRQINSGSIETKIIVVDSSSDTEEIDARLKAAEAERQRLLRKK